MLADSGLPAQEALDMIEFGDLQIEKEIGKGSFGVVHKATYFGADVAVKQFRYSFSFTYLYSLLHSNRNPSTGDNTEFDKYLKREIFVHKYASTHKHSQQSPCNTLIFLLFHSIHVHP
jgi:hypothetical protein